MACQRCKSYRILSVQSHGRDCNSFYLNGEEHQGYVPEGFNLGEGDDVEFDVCLDCGQIQGEYPLPPTILETSEESE